MGHRVDEDAAGYGLNALVAIFWDCHNLAPVATGLGAPLPNLHRIAWPDGQSTLEQPNILIEWFRIIREESRRFLMDQWQ